MPTMPARPCNTSGPATVEVVGPSWTACLAYISSNGLTPCAGEGMAPDHTTVQAPALSDAELHARARADAGTRALYQSKTRTARRRYMGDI